MYGITRSLRSTPVSALRAATVSSLLFDDDDDDDDNVCDSLGTFLSLWGNFATNEIRNEGKRDAAPRRRENRLGVERKTEKSDLQRTQRQRRKVPPYASNEAVDVEARYA